MAGSKQGLEQKLARIEHQASGEFLPKAEAEPAEIDEQVAEHKSKLDEVPTTGSDFAALLYL